MSGFRPCHRCPTREDCAEGWLLGRAPDCDAVRGPKTRPVKVYEPAEPWTLAAAAELVVNHWDERGDAGIETPIELLRQALERGEQQ